MRKIESIIERHTLEALHEALASAGIQNLTVTEVREFGKLEEHKEIYRGEEYKVGFMTKIKIEAIVPQRLVPTAISIIAKKGGMGKSERETITISSVNQVGRMYSHEIRDSI